MAQRSVIVATSCAAAIFIAATCLAQPANLANAQARTRAVSGDVARDIQAIVSTETGPLWVGYELPTNDPRGPYGADWQGRCNLEDRGPLPAVVSSDTTYFLEAPRTFLVLLRIEQKRVEKIRSFSPNCRLDAGGLPFVWLTGVRAADSVALLAEYARQIGADARDDRSRDTGALAALAYHADPAADRVLDELLAPALPETLRERVPFYLGSARRRRGFEVLRRIVKEDASERVRERAVYGLSVSREPEAVAVMIDAARTDRSARVRGQALNWLAQKAGRQVTDTITAAIERDPDNDVKRRAVTALGQLPRDEGIPLLIQVARTNKNPDIRRRAMQVLAQSKDVRAVAFFEEVLTKR
jgi:hypothetical protein